MKNLSIGKEFHDEIDNKQNELINAIRNHQNFVRQLKQQPENLEIEKKLRKAEEEIEFIGLAQKTLWNRLRGEFKVRRKTLKEDIIKNGIEDRRFNLNTALSRARKQNIVSRSATVSFCPVSDDSVEATSLHSSPEPADNPTNPHEYSQSEFLNYFNLVTYDVFKDLQTKRVERKRRSTVNPHFLYGNRVWDFPPQGKRKRNNAYLFTVSPPNTRQALKKKNERGSPPTQGQNGVKQDSKFAPFPPIPHLPSGLTIERVSPGSSSPDSKICVSCRQSAGLLSICESCSNGFHITCHNRPLATSPRQCPRCIVKEVRTIGSLNVPSGMSVSYVTPSEISEKLEEKKRLESMNKSLSSELTQLQDRHSQLTICLKNQQSEREQIQRDHESTEEKIKQILNFINQMKGAKDSDSNK